MARRILIILGHPHPAPTVGRSHCDAATRERSLAEFARRDD
jgi:hypothetical protein